MLTALLIWYVIGVIGCLFLYLGVKDDGEGFDVNDFLFLAFFSLGGACVFIIATPFAYKWAWSWVNSWFENKK